MNAARSLAALRSPNFALLWSAQVISGFGDRITVVALAYVTWQITHSALSTAVAVVMASLPYAIFGFFGGAIADAVGHRRAMIASDLIRALAIGAIPLTLGFQAPLGVAYALVLVAALCSTVFNPARLAIVPELVPAEQLGTSNSLVYASDRTVEIVGVLAAGALVAVLGEGAFYVDAATFALSGILLRMIDQHSRASRRLSWGGVLSDAADGARVLRDHTVLRANTIFSLLAQLSLPVMNGLIPVLVFREYGLGAEEFAATEAAIAAGAVIAGVIYPIVSRGIRKGRLIVGGFATYGVVVVLIAASSGLPLTLALLVLAGFANVLFFVSNVTLSQEVTPPALRARVFGARTALLHLTWLPMILISGGLAEDVPVQPLLAAAGALTFAVAVVGAFFRSIRDVE
ncbi:MAG: MFS transporter [Chloroflexi bacterium]|nr:MFS transporter [Chloroflexota bacterium]